MMIPEALKYKPLKYEKGGITVTKESWEHVPKKKNYYCCTVEVNVTSTDLVAADVHDAAVKAVKVHDGYIELYANKRLEFALDIYVFDDNTVKVGNTSKEIEVPMDLRWNHG